MEDLKKYVAVDSLKLKKCLEKGRLKYLSHISDNIRYWNDLFTYDEDKTELEKFLLYRMAGALDIHGYIDDGDIAPPVFDYLTNKLKTIDHVASVECQYNPENKEKDSSKRLVTVCLDDGTKLYLETDTANSLMYDLGDFFKKVLVKRFGRTWYQNYCKLFQLPEDKADDWYKPFKFYYFYTLVSGSFNGLELSDEEIECLKALEERAKYTHTLKNMIVVPYHYNMFRGKFNSKTCSGKHIRDRLDLTIVDFRDMLIQMDDDSVFQERINDKRGLSSLQSVKFLLDHQKILFPDIPEYTKEMEQNTLHAITLRSKLIVDTLQ